MSVTFEGQIDSVLGGFYCLRGYAAFDEISSHSKADPSYQRDLISEHKNEMRDFLKSGSYVFFPEVILSYSIKTKDNLSLSQIISANGRNTPLKINKNKTTLTLKDEEKLDRIDGNHRLEAFEKNKDILYNFKVPFCIILLDGSEDDLKKKNIIFHNINFKQIPLTKEKSLEILFNGDIYSDDELKSMGLEYLITKKVLDEINKNEDKYKNLPFITYKQAYPKTFMYEAVEFLCRHSAAKSDYIKNEKKIQKKILNALENISTYYRDDYKSIGSCAMFSCLLYYEYECPKMRVNKWFYNTDIYTINDRSAYCDTLDAETLKSLFDGIHDKAVKKVFKASSWIGVLGYLGYKTRDWFVMHILNKLSGYF